MMMGWKHMLKVHDTMKTDLSWDDITAILKEEGFVADSKGVFHKGTVDVHLAEDGSVIAFYETDECYCTVSCWPEDCLSTCDVLRIGSVRNCLSIKRNQADGGTEDGKEDR